MKMSHKKPWFIITPEKIARIRSMCTRIEADKREEDALCVKALSRILHTVEKRRR